jgi:Ca-activated chloride channel family protein
MPRCVGFVLLQLLMLSAAAPLGWAQGLIVIDGAPPRPGHFRFAPLEVTFHHVDVSIDDRVATTQVDQTFHNSSNQRLEGTFLFPLPVGASIDRFSMDIDGRMTDAELLDATKARQAYEQIVRQYRDPALLEYAGRGAMKLRVFPIEPRSDKPIRLRYTQVLSNDQGVMEYTYPLNTEKFSAAPLKDLAIQLRLSSPTPIKSVYSPTHTIEVHRDGSRSLLVSLSARDTRPDTDFKLLITRQPDPIGISVLTSRDAAGNGYFMLMASPGAEVSDAQVQPKDICFVLDTSGSMAGEKLEQAKRALKFCLANLNPSDRFEVVRFSTDAEPLFGKLQPLSSDSLASANRFVDQLRPIGGTAIADALRIATELVQSRSDPARPASIIFLTDGQPTVGEIREDFIVAAVNGAAPGATAAGAGAARPLRIFPFGIGTDINTTLLDRIANNTHAFSQYVLPKEDMEVKVSAFYTRIQSPVLANLRLESGDSRVRLTQVYPPALPDLFVGQTLLAFGRFDFNGADRAGERTAPLRLIGTINGKQQEITTTVSFAADESQHRFIPRLWATRRVGWLLGEIRLHGESDELRQEITALARTHGIVTPYTAYLILEDERRRNVPLALQTLRELGDDREAALRAQAIYDSANGSSGQLQRAGEQAVANAQSLNDLKYSDNAAAPAPQLDELLKLTPEQRQRVAKAKLEQPRGARGDAPVAALPPGGYKESQSYAQQVKVVNGRAFYQNGTTWTDNTAQTKQNLKKQEIKFNSDAYFALLSKYPAALPWFSLGEELDVVLDDTLYVIRGG